MRRRSGFTIVELLVAMALILFIMAILSEAFVAGLTCFRELKSTADLAERLRSTTTILRRELAADHFDGKRRMSQPDFWLSQESTVTSSPPEGFFRIYQGSASVLEGYDTTELNPVVPNVRYMNSYHATNHMLHFTAKLRGNERGDFYSAGDIPASGAALITSQYLFGTRHYEESATVYNSQWAEVVYFLRATGDTAKGGTPLFALYRRQFLLVLDNALLSAPIKGVPSSYPEMSCRDDGTGTGTLYFNNPRDVTMPIRRSGMIPNPNTFVPAPVPAYPANAGLAGIPLYVDTTTTPSTAKVGYQTMADVNAAMAGSDILLSNVLSFEVRILPIGGTQFVDLFDSSLTVNKPGNSVFNGAGQARVFDTWSNMNEKTVAGAPTPAYDYSQSVAANATAQPYAMPFPTTVRPKAIQVIIRVWDEKTFQTRQVTVVQDL